MKLNQADQASVLRKLKKLESLGHEQFLNKLAYGGGLVVEGLCKRNIQQEPSSSGGVAHTGLIDTGFMLNATFTKGADDDNLESAKAAAQSKAGRPFVTGTEPKKHQAIVSNGAEYFANVHQGSSGRPGHPVLLKAATEGESEVKRQVIELARAELKKLGLI